MLTNATSRIDLVGKSFGVVKLGEYDFSVPRRDSKFGLKHRDFRATFDEDITPRAAASRRDFTINAIAYDPVSEEILDFFGGVQDLKNRVLRATGDAFAEDPLRVLRGMQFACRFDLTLDAGTAAMCRTIVDQYSTIARERVAEEFMKWAAKSIRPGRIGEYLTACGWGDAFSRDRPAGGYPEFPHGHPEGDVGTRTCWLWMQPRESPRAMGSKATTGPCCCSPHCATTSPKLPPRRCANATERCAGLRGGMKPTAVLWRGRSWNASRSRRRSWIRWFHWSRIIWPRRASAGTAGAPCTVRRLAMRLAPATITQLLRLIEADYSGRPPLPTGLPEGAIRIRAMAGAQAVEQGPQRSRSFWAGM